MATIVPTLPPAPSDRTDPATYNAIANNWAAALPDWTDAINTRTNEIEVIASAIETDAGSSATDAAISAGQAAVSAATAGIKADVAISAATLVNVLPWVSGSYAVGDPRYSLVNFQTYRCKTAGSRTIDPALDLANWTIITATAEQAGNAGKYYTTDGTNARWESIPAASLYMNSTQGGF